jgi:hypothetical protein
MHGEEDDFCFPVDLTNLSGCVDAIEQGHRDIADHDVGPESFGGGHHRAPIRYFAYDLKVWFQNTTQALADNRVIIG